MASQMKYLIKLQTLSTCRRCKYITSQGSPITFEVFLKTVNIDIDFQSSCFELKVLLPIISMQKRLNNGLISWTLNMEYECKQWKTKGLLFHHWKQHQCVRVWMRATIPPPQTTQPVVAHLQQLHWKSFVIKLWWIWILKSNKKHSRAFGGTRVQYSYDAF